MRPLATYRLQFNRLFRFSDAASVVPYLNGLCVSTVYASPVFKPGKNSLHGYDIVDQNALNPALGDETDFRELLLKIKGLRMGWLQDIVPNHMAYDGDNSLLMDIFEKGPSSRNTGFFDLEWNPGYEGIKGRILAPFLGRFYGDALESGEIRLKYDAEGFSINYSDLRFPLRIESYVNVLTHVLLKIRSVIGREHPDFIKLLGIFYVIKNLPAEKDETFDQVRFIKRMLWELCSRNPSIEESLDRSLAEINGTPGDPGSFNDLDGLLKEQFYKLSFWKVAAEEINYRRFFNINGLITLRVEEEDAFTHTHRLVVEMVRSMGVDGLRVDHVDGLYDPLDYLKRLKDRTGDIYVTAEKVLATNEELRREWPVDGSTGYDFLCILNGIFCDTANEARLTKIYSNFTGLKDSFEELLYQKKRLIIEMDMTGDVSNLAELLRRTLLNDRHGSDITLQGLKRAITEVMAFFPIYRTYVSRGSYSESDRLLMKEAVWHAARRNPALLNELRFLEKVLTLEYADYFTGNEKDEWLHFVMKFQQFTGPLMAKGLEDTLLYVYNRLISLNEVGVNPGKFGNSVEEFHVFNGRRAPGSMNATSTHDTKRGEDVRARINILSEIPDEWASRLRRWSSLTRKMKKPVEGRPSPDRNDEYFLYQTLVGAMPCLDEEHGAFVERIKDYAVKAVREAKVHTAWLKPDIEYEEAFVSFIDNLLKRSGRNPFLEDFMPFQKKIAWYGMLNSLSQVILKITAPGIPDFFQGTELWDLNLVDPDNRRPVDFAKRAALLKEIKDKSTSSRASLIPELLGSYEDGRIKLFLIHAALRVRRELADAFENGGYVPLEVKGSKRSHVVAFARTGKKSALTIASRFFTSLAPERQPPVGEVWADTEVVLPEGLAERVWINEITGEELRGGISITLKDALRDFPVALMTGRSIKERAGARPDTPNLKTDFLRN